MQYQRLLSIAPNRIEADAALGSLLNELGDPVDADAHLERAYAAAPWYVPTIAELGIAREGTGHAADAVPLLRRALAWVESDAALAKRIRAALQRAEAPGSASAAVPPDAMPTNVPQRAPANTIRP